MIIHGGLRHCSATGSTLAFSLEGNQHVRLEGGEVQRLLDEIAWSAPEVLHMALERRQVRLITEAVTSLREELTS
jgi:hypothetical protein